MAFVSRVERVISASHFNGPDGNKCSNMHGHDWRVIVQFTYTELNEWGWGPDFGEIKKIIDKYDHGVGAGEKHMTLNKHLAPLPPSAENFAKRLFEELADRFNLAPDFVRVHEGQGNSVSYSQR